MRTGIYQIKNLTKNIVYIGASCNIDKRIKGHFNLMSKRKHYVELMNLHYSLQRDTFVWGILEYCNVSKLPKRERHYYRIAQKKMMSLEQAVYNSYLPAYRPPNSLKNFENNKYFWVGRKFVVFYKGEMVNQGLSGKDLTEIYGICLNYIDLFVSGKKQTFCGCDIRIDPCEKIWSSVGTATYKDLIHDPFLTKSYSVSLGYK